LLILGTTIFCGQSPAERFLIIYLKIFATLFTPQYIIALFSPITKITFSFTHRIFCGIWNATIKKEKE